MRFARLTLAALVAGACAPAIHAQNVVFTNSSNAQANPYTIPLLNGSAVVVDPSGNLKAQCQLEAGTTRCAGMPAGTVTNPPPANAPGVTLTTTAVDNDAATAGVQVETGAVFTLNGSATNSPEACVRSSTPAIAGWDGSVLPSGINASVALSSNGAHDIKLRCFNGAGAGESAISLIGTTTPGNNPPPTGGEPAECANIRAQTGASGFQRVTTSSVISGSTGGSITRNLSTLRGLYGGQIDSSLYYFKTVGGQYIAMQFKGTELEADIPMSSYSPGGQQHTGQPLAGFTYMTISKCQGDFRLRSQVGFNDPNLACTSDLAGGLDNLVSFNLQNAQSTNAFLTAGNVCTLDRNATYYVNVVFADPTVNGNNTLGLHPGEIQCANGASCGIKYGTL